MTKVSSFLDMDSIRSLGLAEFSRHYFWPVSDKEFTTFVDTALRRFEQLIIETDQDIFDAVLADYRFLAYVFQHIHYRAAARGLGVDYRRASNLGPTLTNFLLPDWREHIDYLSETNLRSGHFGNRSGAFKSKLGRSIRNTVNTFRSNQSHSILCHARNILTSSPHLSIGPYTSFKHAFLNGLDDYSKTGEWDKFGIPSTQTPDPTFSQRLKSQFLVTFLDFLNEQTAGFSAGYDADGFKAAWTSRLSVLNSLYNGFRQIQTCPKELSITAAGNPIRKIFATALRRNGTRIYVLHHGECAGVERYPHAHRNDGTFADFFVCPNPKVRQNFQSNYSDSLIPKRTGVRYINSNVSQYQEMLETYRNRNTHAPKKKVMLIGFGMNHFRYLDGAGYFYYFQLDLQYRVARHLSNNGFDVTYKVHPDRAQEVGSLFSVCSNHIETRRFEEVWDTASAYIFTHPGTTVFGHAVFTEKPILIVDLENNNWNQAGYELIKKRCQVVSGTFNEENRIIFDEKDLLHKVGNPLPLNDEYIEQLLVMSPSS